MHFLRRSMVGTLLFAATLGLLGFAAYTVRDAVATLLAEEDRQRPARERIFAANVVAFEPTTITPVLSTFGEVRSRQTLELRATASGRIVELAETFEEGGRVEAGQLLLRVDPADAQSAYDIAQADLKEAEAEQREARASLDLVREEVIAAEDQLALRSQALLRAIELLERRVGNEATVESAALAESSARQALLAQRQALAQAEARVDRAATTLQRRAIALADAQRRLDDTAVYAAFSGTLTDVSVLQGGLVQNNERLGELVAPDALEVAFRVSTAEYARLLDESGRLIPATAEVTLDVLGAGLTTQAVVSRESAEVGDGLTGRLLFAQLTGAAGFRPGDFVTVSVAEPDLRFVVSLPATAVDSQNTVLIVGEGDRLELASVEVLRRQGDRVLVRSRDLRGREVVAERSPLLGEGIRIRPLRPDDSTAPEPPAMVELTDERRARLVALVQGNTRMPAEAKERVLSTLAQPMVPARMVERIEGRMGG